MEHSPRPRFAIVQVRCWHRKDSWSWSMETRGEPAQMPNLRGRCPLGHPPGFNASEPKLAFEKEMAQAADIVTEDKALLGSNLSAGDGPKLAGAVRRPRRWLSLSVTLFLLNPLSMKFIRSLCRGLMEGLPNATSSTAFWLFRSGRSITCFRMACFGGQRNRYLVYHPVSFCVDDDHRKMDNDLRAV